MIVDESEITRFQLMNGTVPLKQEGNKELGILFTEYKERNN